jgi:transglutaminase-like putative cysteine protease
LRHARPWWLSTGPFCAPFKEAASSVDRRHNGRHGGVPKAAQFPDPFIVDEEDESMSINRRALLRAGAALTAAAAISNPARAEAAFDPRPGAWRRFDVTTRVELAEAAGAAKTQAWIPVPAVNEQAWFKSLGHDWRSNGHVTLVSDATGGTAMLHVEWERSEQVPLVEVTSRIATRDRAIDFTKPDRPVAISPAEREDNLKGTAFIPVDGIVKETSDKIVGNADARSDIEKARAIYEWIVDNTYRDAKVAGCGSGDIVAMLKTGKLGGKCADLNALYVGLARAAGVPARDIYGIRVAPSRFGFKSLGPAGEVVTNAQHCRSEIYLTDIGWVPVDPADVRKVILEEPPKNLAIDDPKVRAVRKVLFGAWETNWLAYNQGHDIALPGSDGPKLAFLMYPQAEIDGRRVDCHDSAGFKYVITAKELEAT